MINFNCKNIEALQSIRNIKQKIQIFEQEDNDFQVSKEKQILGKDTAYWKLNELQTYLRLLIENLQFLKRIQPYQKRKFYRKISRFVHEKTTAQYAKLHQQYIKQYKDISNIIAKLSQYLDYPEREHHKRNYLCQKILNQKKKNTVDSFSNFNQLHKNTKTFQKTKKVKSRENYPSFRQQGQGVSHFYYDFFHRYIKEQLKREGKIDPWEVHLGFNQI